MTIVLPGRGSVERIMWRGKPVDRIMWRGQRLYSASTLFDDFERADGPLDKNGGQWHNEGPSLDHVASIVGGRMRLGIPDGLIGLFERISYMRFTGGTATSEDGWLQCQVASTGDSIRSFMGDLLFRTQLYGRSNVRDGVGIDLAASQLGIVVRRNLGETIVAQFGGFSAGDVIDLHWQGPDYEMFRNGRSVGGWIDRDGKVAGGSDHRSMMVRVDGSKDLLGPRRFSPALGWAEYGSAA